MISCTFEDGKPAVRGLRHVTVGALVINEHNQVLLVKRPQYLHNGGKYTIPGGFLDRNETTQEGAIRELREETGYEGEIVSLFTVNDNPNRPKEDRQNVDFLYVIKIKSGSQTLNREVTYIRWFDKDNLPKEGMFAFDHRAFIVEYFNKKS